MNRIIRWGTNLIFNFPLCSSKLINKIGTLDYTREEKIRIFKAMNQPDHVTKFL